MIGFGFRIAIYIAPAVVERSNCEAMHCSAVELLWMFETRINVVACQDNFSVGGRQGIRGGCCIEGRHCISGLPLCVVVCRCVTGKQPSPRVLAVSLLAPMM